MVNRNKTFEWVQKSFLLVIVISPLPIFFSVYLPAHLGTPVQQVSWVTWGTHPQAEIIIGWETIEQTTGIVYLGSSPQNFTTSIPMNNSNNIHTLKLSGLTEDTKYYYEIRVDDETYTGGSFTTAPNSLQPFSFGLISDTQQKAGPGWTRRTANILGDKEYAFVALIGDFVENGIKDEWNHFFKVAGSFLDTIPLVPIIGNHDRPRDLDGDGSDEYYFGEYFPQTLDSQKNMNSYDIYDQFYFSFNWSSVHFQVLHFPEIDVDDPDDYVEGGMGVSVKDYYRAFTEDHINWIKEDLENAQSLPFRISMFHCPITSAGFYGPNQILIEELLPVLLQYNVSVIVNGHAHHFERGLFENPLNPENPLTYFLVANGGGLTDIALRPVPETQVTAMEPSYTEVYVTATKLTFTTRSLEGDIIDIYEVGGA